MFKKSVKVGSAVSYSGGRRQQATPLRQLWRGAKRIVKDCAAARHSSTHVGRWGSLPREDDSLNSDSHLSTALFAEITNLFTHCDKRRPEKPRTSLVALRSSIEKLYRLKQIIR